MPLFFRAFVSTSHHISKEMECHRWNEICCKSSLLLRKLHILGHFSAAVFGFATAILKIYQTFRVTFQQKLPLVPPLGSTR